MILAEVELVWQIDQMSVSNTVVITVLEICVLTKLEHGDNWKIIDIVKASVTILMGVLFVWCLFLVCIFHQ